MESNIDVQGHRGCRGILPENSIIGFLKALEIGVNTLEMDVVITGDKQVLVSHEPFMNHEICLDPEGNDINRELEKNFNIYKMDYNEVQKFECGLKFHPRFPDQEKVSVFKPLLREVIAAADAFCENNQRTKAGFNIEVKSKQNWYGQFQPYPEEFMELVLGVIKENNVEDRVTVQSFDFNVLRHLKEKYPDIQNAVLVENERNFNKIIEGLGFTPDIYSPNFHLLDSKLIDFCKSEGIRLIPWTVNTKENIQIVLDHGVDGIISDYPDRVFEIVASR